MSDRMTMPEPPDLTETVFGALEDKAGLSTGPMIVLGILAGVYIGLGGMFAIVALAGAETLPYGVGQVLAGVVFSLGLVLVMVAGAELFTGNTMMAGPVRAGRLPAGQAAGALATVYAANFVGGVLLALLVWMSGLHDAAEGAVGRAAVDLGETKTGKSFGALLASGVLANMLVCLAVWLAYAGNTVTEKVVGLLMPIAAFVAAGFEHSVANMFLLPYAYLVQIGADGPATALTLAGIIGNLVPATLGNLIGGGLIALAYGQVYARR